MRTVFSIVFATVIFVTVFTAAKLGPAKQSSPMKPAAFARDSTEPVEARPQQNGAPHQLPVPAPLEKPIGKADLVTVDKSERRMQLLRNGQIIASYAIALGDAPEGAKQKEGDERTPEGRYTIDWRNPKSNYFLSLHISYPDAADRARAKAAGVSPGGDIMIHGQPNGYDVAGAVLQKFDWTDGCIAVTNAEMQQIWDAVPDGTPIEITP
jgi:lipoprotein-anchoring transpeptidase ErfK/SrfK